MIHVVASFDFTAAGQSKLPAGVWAPPDARGSWSLQRECPVEVPVPAGPGAVLLDIEIDSQVQHAVVRHRNLAVSVDGVLAGERRVGGRLVWTVAAPHAGGVVRLQFTDRDYTARSPRGVRLVRIKVLRDTHAALPAPRQGMREFRFSWNDTTEAMLGEGWGSPEDAYVWAVGGFSVLHVTVPDDGAALLAVLDMYPYIRGDTRRQRVIVAVDGRTALSLELVMRVSVAVTLFPAPGQTSVTLSFRNLDADFATSDPHFHFGRPFAWFLSSLRLLPALPRYLPGVRQRLPGSLADGSLQRVVALLTGLPAADLAARFEGLGNGCELGLLQQSFGRDSPGLLRFAAVRQRELVEGLLHGFHGVARADRVEWSVRREEDDTWRLIEKTYELSSASPYSRHRPAPDFRVETRRLPRLADKLMEDVAAGAKIFVLRISPEPAIEAAALAVLAALRRFGDADMVWLVTDGAMPPGSAERLPCGLIRGHLEPPQSGLAVSAEAMMSALANCLVLLLQGQRLPAARLHGESAACLKNQTLSVAQVKPPPDRLYGRQRSHALRPRQQKLLAETLPRLRYAVAAGFGGAVRETWLEVGFGGGEHARALAAANPGVGVIAAEVFEQGLCSMLAALVPEGGEADAAVPANLRIWDQDARDLLRALPAASLDRLYLMFPDPWPKARHAKRRFVHPDIVALVASRLKPGAEWRAASDDPTYQAWVDEVMGAQPFFSVAPAAAERPTGWPPTRYEAKALAAGRRPLYWVFRNRTG